MLVNTCNPAKVSSFFENDAFYVTFVDMKPDNKILWNEAGRVGLVFGLFSSVCLGLKEASALTGSTFVVTAAAVILWAVEFFGCILLMKKYMLDLRDKYDGTDYLDAYKFGRRVALLSGLILAAVDAVLIMHLPQETVEAAFAEATAAVTSKLGSSYAGEAERMMDMLPAATFFGQWLYCFLYGSLLSAILSRYIFLQNYFQEGGDNGDGNDMVDNQ